MIIETDRNVSEVEFDLVFMDVFDDDGCRTEVLECGYVFVAAFPPSAYLTRWFMMNTASFNNLLLHMTLPGWN